MRIIGSGHSLEVKDALSCLLLSFLPSFLSFFLSFLKCVQPSSYIHTEMNGRSVDISTVCICIHTYIHTFTHPYIHSFIHSYIHTFIHSYIHTFIHSYMHTFIHTHSFIHSYIHTYIHIHRVKAEMKDGNTMLAIIKLIEFQ